MITYTKGNIFDAGTQAIVNTVNCVGVMGAGLAKQFRIRYPDNFKEYYDACVEDELTTGRVLVTHNLDRDFVYIVNFPTKDHFKDDSKMEYITQGLTAMKAEMSRLNIESIAIPALGCGLGNLEWKTVKEQIELTLSDCECRIVVYEPLS